MYQLTLYQKAWAVARKNQGASISEIARELNFSRTAIRNAIQRYEETGSFERKPNPGRPKKFTGRDVRALKHHVLNNRRETLSEIMVNIPVNAGINTFRKELKHLNLNSRIARKKPFINDKQRLKRLNFAKEHQHWTLEDWRRVIFTDESSFQTSGCSSIVRVRRRPNEVMLPSCLAPTFQSGRSSFSVWGGISYNRRSPLVFLKEGERKSASFIDQVYDPVLKDFYNSYTNSPILMEDNAPIHTSKLSRNWKENAKFVCLDWPPQSPDLNPIEHVWKKMKAAKQKRLHFVKSKTALKMLVAFEWRKLDVNYINKLIDSMPRRMKAVIKNKGYSIKY